MDTKELSAKYIYDDEERRQLALLVYEAMPTVREYLIKGIFELTGKHIAEKIDGVEYVWDGRCVTMWTEEIGEYYVSAWLYGSRSASLVAGVCHAEPASIHNAERSLIQDRLKKKVNLEVWSGGDVLLSDTAEEEIAYAYVHHEYYGGRWDQDGFLKRAIQSEDEVVSHVADVLVQIYKGVFPLS